MPFCATESISSDPNLFAFVVDSNVIPISKLVADIIMHGFITAQNFVQRFVRKNDAKTRKRREPAAARQTTNRTTKSALPR